MADAMIGTRPHTSVVDVPPITDLLDELCLVVPAPVDQAAVITGTEFSRHSRVCLGAHEHGAEACCKHARRLVGSCQPMTSDTDRNGDSVKKFNGSVISIAGRGSVDSGVSVLRAVSRRNCGRIDHADADGGQCEIDELPAWMDAVVDDIERKLN